MRVAQPWAGNNWGTMFIPRIGMEVLIHFLEGDPDQPIITGCVYNPQTMPPYKLPDEKNKSGIKTNSTKGGGGYNELRFDDTKGKEQIFIHGQRNEDILIENDCMESIGKDRHLTVGGKQIESVGSDVHLTVSGDRNEKVGSNLSVDVGSKVDEKVGSSYALQAGTAIELKAGMNAVVEAGASLTLKVGGNFININSAGIFIKGTMVMINSGGAAGAGPGCNTTTPEKPKDADKAEAGKKIQQIDKPPAKQSPKFASLAAMSAKAGKKGQKAMTKSDIAKLMASIEKSVAEARAAALREAAKETASQVGKMISATALAIPFVGRAVGAGE
jgi:type VI secretion system secreted protein VgrG